MSLGAYRKMWFIPGAPLLLVGGVVARIGLGVTILAWVLLIRETTGSYGQAGLVSAAMSVATACAAPVGGRLADCYGPSRVLPYFAVTFALSQLGLLVAVLLKTPLPLLCIIAALSGLCLPPLGPALRAGWTVLTSPESGRGDARGAAMAAESTLVELVFVVGPLLLSLCVFIATLLNARLDIVPNLVGPAVALAAAALCTGIGTVAVARGRAMRELRPAVSDQTNRGLGALRLPGFPMLLLCAGCVAFSFGGGPVAIAAFSQVHDGASAQTATGILYAIWGVGSAVSGLWFGTQQFTVSLQRQLMWLLVGVCGGYAAWIIAPNSAVLGLVILLTGAFIAPTLTVEASIVGRLAPRSLVNESFTWLTAINLLAAAIGSAVTGVLVDPPGGPRVGFFAALTTTALAAAVASWPGAMSPPQAKAEMPTSA